MSKKELCIGIVFGLGFIAACVFCESAPGLGVLLFGLASLPVLIYENKK